MLGDRIAHLLIKYLRLKPQYLFKVLRLSGENAHISGGAYNSTEVKRRQLPLM